MGTYYSYNTQEKLPEKGGTKAKYNLDSTYSRQATMQIERKCFCKAI